MGSCVHCSGGLNTSEILQWDKEPDPSKVRLPAPTAVYLWIK